MESFRSMTKTIGVLEFVTASKYLDCAYEVEQVHRILKEACSVHHLKISQGVIGRAFSSHGSYFCGDVKKLDEKEYSLVHKSRTTELASSFSIYLPSNEHDAEHVLEFFLPVDMKEGADIQNMVQTLKQHLKSFSGFELGDLLSAACIAMSMEIDTLSLAMQPNIIQTSLSRELVQIDSQTSGETNAPVDCINSQADSDISNSNNSNPGSAILEKTISVEKGYNSGEKQISTRQRRKRKLHSFTLETVRLYFGMPIGEVSRRLGVSRSTLKRVCRELGILTWPKPRLNKKYTHFGIYTAMLLLVKLKRWICSSNHHGFSAWWWLCDKHYSPVSKLKLSIQAYSSSIIISPLGISPADDPHFPPPYFSKPLKELGVLDTRNVTVKATFNHDTVKFDFPISFGLMQLKIEVAQRLKLQSTKIHLKYRDEDDDLILIACDADLHNLMPFSATSGSKATLKLIVEMSHEDKSIK